MPFELASFNEPINSIQVKKFKFGIGGEEDMTFETHAAFSTIEFLG
jgi:hypothetical protein